MINSHPFPLYRGTYMYTFYACQNTLRPYSCPPALHPPTHTHQTLFFGFLLAKQPLRIKQVLELVYFSKGQIDAGEFPRRPPSADAHCPLPSCTRLCSMYSTLCNCVMLPRAYNSLPQTW